MINTNGKRNVRQDLPFERCGDVSSLALALALSLSIFGCGTHKRVQASIPTGGEPASEAIPAWPLSSTSGPDAANLGSLSQPRALPFSIVPANPALPLWFPSRMGDEKPYIERQTPCPLNDVLGGAMHRVDELIANMNRFGATEELTHENLSKNGRVISKEKRKFEYVASITTLPSGQVTIDEFRNGNDGTNGFPDGISTQGLPALMFVFQRRYQDNYDFECEGLGKWDDSPTWVVYFRQRNDRPTENLRYVVDEKSYDVAIEGRAWIATGTFQLLRMESDVLNPIPKIHLTDEHEDIVYKPVTFKERNVTMWLPANAELYFYFRHHLYHRIQAFKSYVLFSVSTTQKIGSAPAPQHP